MNMSSRCIVLSFQSDVDGTTVNELGDVLVPGGKQLLSEVGDRLSRKAFEVGEVCQVDDFGWACTVCFQKIRFLLTIQQVTDWIIVIHRIGYLHGLLWRRYNREKLRWFAHEIQSIIEDENIGKNVRLLS